MDTEGNGKAVVGTRGAAVGTREVDLTVGHTDMVGEGKGEDRVFVEIHLAFYLP